MKFKVTKWTIGAFLLLILLVLYLSGPTPPNLVLKTDIPKIDLSPVNLEKEIEIREKNTPFIKPDNEARVIWFDSSQKSKTSYCIVYIHGFSATWKEADPVHKDLAKKYGCNLYLPRLFAHGLNEEEPLLNFDAEKYLESVRLAIGEAKVLGEKVILMSTSTGGTASLILASENTDIEAIILYSPNIQLFDSKAFVLTQPWGLQLARRVVKSDYYTFEGNEEVQKYWNTRYRIEALIVLKNLLDHTMKPGTFNKIKQPVLLCYYFKNENEQDKVVSVPAMLKMYDELGTDPALKRKVTLPDVHAHALAAGLNSKDISSVEKVTSEFMEEVLKLKPVK